MNGVQEYNLNGFATFETRNKKPLAKGWKSKQPDIFAKDAQEFGVVLSSEHLVVDIDVKNGSQGEPSWANLCSIIKTTATPKTFTVSTPSGGRHIYFKKPADLKLRTTLKTFPGIDFITQGHPVTGAGSRTIKGAYIQTSATDAIADAPAELLTLLVKHATTDPVDVDPTVTYHDTQYNTERLQAHIVAMKAIPAGERNKTMYTTAHRARDYGLSPEKALEIMTSEMIPLCEGEVDSTELRTCITSAYNGATTPQGVHCPEKMFTAVAQSETTTLAYARMEFDKTDKGAYKPTARNAVNLIRGRSEISTYLRYNRFTHRVELDGVMPWENVRTSRSNIFNDGDYCQLEYYLASHFNVSFPPDALRRAVAQVGMLRGYHPVYDYLDNLVWDKVPRINRWVQHYAGAAEGAAQASMGRCCLIGAVARVYDPGCKVDSMLVLEGPQGVGKSAACAILGGEWFSDVAIDPASTNGIQAMQGRWIIEMPEMSVFDTTASQNQLKKFLTTQIDTARFAYGVAVNEYPRQCIFIGTFNPQHGIGYLKDDTGNRRYHPIRCAGDIKLTQLQHDRDQLWAEAVHAYKTGAKWYETDPIIAAAIQAEIRKREIGDPWHELIQEWLISAKKKLVTIKEVFENAIGRQAGTMTRFEQVRVAKILGALGFQRGEGRLLTAGDKFRGVKYGLANPSFLGVTVGYYDDDEGDLEL